MSLTVLLETVTSRASAEDPSHTEETVEVLPQRNQVLASNLLKRSAHPGPVGPDGPTPPRPDAPPAVLWTRRANQRRCGPPLSQRGDTRRSALKKRAHAEERARGPLITAAVSPPPQLFTANSDPANGNHQRVTTPLALQ